ncbi:MAG TPA: nucleotide disphospho-sugar-binding domain-containing protein, partial [Acidimicrobiales bacterium]
APSRGAGLYDHLYLHPLPDSIGGTLSSSRARRIRPMHFDGSVAAAPPRWIGAFGRHRPGVYVTFGTEVASLAPWGEILEALRSADVDAVATIGSSIEQAELGHVPPNVRVERFVPQGFVLSRTSAVVSHAGSGTAFAAASRGIPQLCMPIAADQWSNSDALTAAGAAITLESDERSAAGIGASLAGLLGDSAYTETASAIAHDFAELAHPSEFVHTIEALAPLSY